MNVKVTGVPMWTRCMSTSVDPRSRPARDTTVPKRSVGIQTLMYESSTSPRSPHNHTTTGLALWSSLTLGDQITPVGPGKTFTVNGCPSRWEGCGWPETTTSDKKTTAHSNMVAEQVLTYGLVERTAWLKRS